jgi:excisionase family DNA binding protein
MNGWKRRGPRNVTVEHALRAPEEQRAGDTQLAENGDSPFPTAHSAVVPVPAVAAYLSVDEAAALLRVDRKTIHRAVAAGELPYLRLGRVIRIPTAALARPSKSA